MPKQAGAIELLNQRKEDVKVWRNPDGTRTAEFGADQHYPDGSGAYQVVDLNFRQVSTTEWVAEKSRIRIRAYRESGVNWLEITHRASGKGIRYQIPLSATVQNDYVEFAGFGLTWRYYLTRDGVKLESSPVASSLGPKSYDFTVGLVGGATLAQVANAVGGLDGEGFLIPRAQAHCADGVVRDLSAWSRSGSTATFSLDDTSFPPEAYPYTVDPTTSFAIATNDDDQEVERNANTYPPDAGTFSRRSTDVDGLEATKYTNGTTYWVRNLLMRWDTSSLSAAATITGATVRAYILTWTADGIDLKNLTAGWYQWDGVSTSDYTSTAETNAHAGTLISSITVAALNDFALDNAAANVNSTGYTYLRWHLSGGQPSGANTVAFRPIEQGGTPPTLIVDYTVPWDETMGPTAVSGLTNLTGLVTDIDQDPDGTITDVGLVGSNPSGLSVANVYPNARVGATGQTAFAWGGAPANVIDASDTTFSTEATATTDPADYFSFAAGAFSAIPAGSVITGISVDIKHNAGTSGRATPWLQLGTANGTLIGSEINPQTNSTTGATLGTTAVTQTATAFGALPTLAQLQTSGAAGFGVRLRLVRSTTTTYVLFSIKVTVTYNAVTNTQADVAMDDPVGTLATGASTGEIRARFRKKGSGSDPQGRLEVRNAAGTLLGTPIANTTISDISASGTIVDGVFDQSIILNKTDVVLRFVGTGASGGLAELVAVEWNVDTQVAGVVASDVYYTPLTILPY